MDIQQKKILKQILQNQFCKIKKEIMELRDACKPVAPDCAIGRISRMDAINNRAVAERGLRIARQKQQLMDLALKNIGNKNYGHCVACKQKISFKRLEIIPFTRFCVKCKS